MSHLEEYKRKLELATAKQLPDADEERILEEMDEHWKGMSEEEREKFREGERKRFG